MRGLPALLVSACLLGEQCKYDGGNNVLRDGQLRALEERYRLIPVCPERDGGLPTPRTPSERRGDEVWTRDGRDVTAAFRRGAALALEAARREGCQLALLKERSPSCGHGRIYDGTFTGALVPGDGIAAELLADAGIVVFGESELSQLLEAADAEKMEP